MKRCFVFAGDQTTAGGVVLEGCGTYTWNGRQVAFDGARIACPACQSTGILQCVEPRLPTTLSNGAAMALEKDVCLCRCSRPPRLMASQSAMWMEAGGEMFTARGSSEGAAANAFDARHPVYRGRFQLIDRDSGQPQAGVAGRVRCSDGQCVDCVTDANGYTVWIESDEPNELTFEALQASGS